MQLHQLKPVHKLKKKKRIGRGGKRGTYSGRGQKGQKSRAGAKIRPADRDLIMRIPKLRGVKNQSIKAKPLILNVDELEKIGKDLINKDFFLKAGLIKRHSDRVKVLGRGDLKKSFQVEGLEISGTAKKKIEKAGGKVK